MISLPDTNILLDAVNPAASRHRICRDWLSEKCAEGSLGWTGIALLGFVRLSTRRVVFGKPLSIGEAMDIVDGWLAIPNSRLLLPTTAHFTFLRRFLSAAGTAGNLVTDAHLAALAIEHGAELCSCDTDFGRFPHLRWFNPATGSRTRPAG